MKFVCERCHTKYSVADEKVRQKILKIRCKTCENVITIRDAVVISDPSNPRAEPPPSPSGQAPRSVEWHLAINGRQEGPVGLHALCTRVQSAGRQDEIYVWNEHLDGWKEPKLVPEVAAELRARAALAQPPAPPGQRRSPTPPGARGLPPPGGTGRSSSGMPAISARASASHQAVSAAASPARKSSAMPAVSSFDDEVDEKTQISAMDASMLYPDKGGASPDRGARKGIPTGSGIPAVSDANSPMASLLDLSISRPLPTRPSQANPSQTAREAELRANGRRNSGAGAAASGLEALDFVPVPVAASQRASGAMPATGALPMSASAGGGVVAAPVIGGSTSMLLSQIGGRAARVRHPAIKYVVTGGILVGLIIVVSVMSMSGGDKSDASPSAVVATAGAPQPSSDPEAVARAEAEKYFKSMVGDSKPDRTRLSSKTVGPPAPRRGAPPPRPKNSADSTKPPPLAPPPIGTGAPAASGTGVARRLGPEERRVAAVNQRKDSQAQGTAFDMGKVMGVVRQQDHTSAIKSCYERALKRDDKLMKGRLEIEVTVAELGSVRKVRIDPPTDFGGASGCIRDTVRRWRFPATGAEYAFSFPFIFAGTSE
jgi:predicted Zn finger-like uncharacterized protein